MNRLKNILATIWLIFWALRIRWAGRNDYASRDKAEGEFSIEGE